MRSVLVNSHGDMVVRKLEVTITEWSTYQSNSTNTLIVNMLQLLSWPQHGLPHPTSIVSLVEQLTMAQMRSSSKQTVVMCRSEQFAKVYMSCKKC